MPAMELTALLLIASVQAIPIINKKNRPEPDVLTGRQKSMLNYDPSEYYDEDGEYIEPTDIPTTAIVWSNSTHYKRKHEDGTISVHTRSIDLYDYFKASAKSSPKHIGTINDTLVGLYHGMDPSIHNIKARSPG